MGRLLGPTTCLLHKDGGILLSSLPQATTGEIGGFFSTLCLSSLALNVSFSIVFWYDLTVGLNLGLLNEKWTLQPLYLRAG